MEENFMKRMQEKESQAKNKKKSQKKSKSPLKTKPNNIIMNEDAKTPC